MISAVSTLTVLIMFEQEALHAYFALDPTQLVLERVLTFGGIQCVNDLCR